MSILSEFISKQYLLLGAHPWNLSMARYDTKRVLWCRPHLQLLPYQWYLEKALFYGSPQSFSEEQTFLLQLLLQKQEKWCGVVVAPDSRWTFFGAFLAKRLQVPAFLGIEASLSSQDLFWINGQKQLFKVGHEPFIHLNWELESEHLEAWIKIFSETDFQSCCHT